MNILMVGPGYGSNMQLWMEHMDTDKNNKYFLLSTTKVCEQFKLYENIEIVCELSENKFINTINVLNAFRKLKFDCIHMHGAYNKRLTLLICKIFKGEIILNIWGQWFIDGLLSRNDRYFKKVIKRSDYVFVNWWDSYNQLVKYSSEIKEKLYVTPWGITNRSINKLKENCKIRNLKNFNINDDDFFIFIPRGLLRHNGIHIIIESLVKIKELLPSEQFEKIKVYIKTANGFDEEYYNEINKVITKNALDRVKIEKGLLTEDEYIALSQRADLSVFMSTNDMLTNAIIDSIYAKTNLILSNIGPYRELVNRYKLNIPLIEINNESLADKIVSVFRIEGRIAAEENLKKIGEDFVFNKNIIKTINIYTSKK